MGHEIEIIKKEGGFSIKVTLFTKNGTYITDSKIVFKDKAVAVEIANSLERTFQNSAKVA